MYRRVLIYLFKTSMQCRHSSYVMLQHKAIKTRPKNEDGTHTKTSIFVVYAHIQLEAPGDISQDGAGSQIARKKDESLPKRGERKGLARQRKWLTDAKQQDS